MSQEKKIREKKKPTLLHAVIPLLGLLVCLGGGYAYLKLPTQVCLLAAAAVAAVVAWSLGLSWDDMVAGMTEKVTASFGSIMVMICVGAMISSWMFSGTIPMMIYYGIKLIDPRFLFVTGFLVCAILQGQPDIDCDGHRLVVDVDLPLVGEIDAGEHIHQRGLAAAVLAQQGQDLAFVQFKVYIFVCDDLAAEPLGDVLHSDRAFLFQGCHPFFRRRWLQHLEYAGDKFHTTYSTIHVERCKSKSAKNLSGIYKECEVTQERVILFV